MMMKQSFKWYDNKHNKHPIVINKKTSGPHYAELRCTHCNKWIKWLTKVEYETLKEN